MNELPPFPHETLYSWITRYHLKCGIGNEIKTFKKIFQTRTVQIHAYLPNRLDCLSNQGGLSPQEWLNRHTLHPLFKLFGHDVSHSLSKAMMANTGNVMAHAHISQSNLTFPYGHKFCPLCAKEFKAKHGFAIYDIRYQMPGVEVCPIHNCLLHYVNCSSYPAKHHLTLPKYYFDTPGQHRLLSQFSKFCFDVFKVAKSLKHQINTRDLYHQILIKKGFITTNNRVRMKLLIKSISSFYRNFPFQHGWEPLHNFQFIGALLRPHYDGICHPAKHLLFTFWLFDKNADMFNFFTEMPEKVEMSAPNSDKQNVLIEMKVINLIKQGFSMTQIHLKTGKSRWYIRRRMGLLGKDNLSKCKTFSPETTSYFIALVLRGKTNQALAKLFGVGVGYVKQFISSINGLSARRKKLNFRRKKKACLKELKLAAKQHPDWKRTDFYNNCGSAVSFIYKTDKALLELIFPPAIKPTRPQKDWKAEDNRLVLAINNLNAINDMPITAILAAINGKGNLYKNTDKLPKTKALLMKLGKLH